MITTSFLPLRTTRKPEEFHVTICAAVVAPSRISHPPHPNDNVMKPNSNHAFGR